MAIKHRFASAKTDGTDATLVQPSNWNDTHNDDAGLLLAVDESTLDGKASKPNRRILAAGTGIALTDGGAAGNLSVAVNQTSVNGSVATNVTMTSAGTFYDGPSVTLTAGTWLLIGYITISSANATAQRVTAKLWDGTTVYASSETAAPSQGTSTAGYLSIDLSGVVVLAAGATLKISATSTAASSILRAAVVDNATGTGNTASQLSAVRIA